MIWLETSGNLDVSFGIFHCPRTEELQTREQERCLGLPRKPSRWREKARTMRSTAPTRQPGSRDRDRDRSPGLEERRSQAGAAVFSTPENATAGG